VEQHPEHCSDASVKNPAITVHVTRQQLTGRDGVDPVGGGSPKTCRSAEIARQLRMSTNSVYGWRAGGRAALASRGPGGSRCWLDQQWLDRQAQALDEGSAGAHRDSVDG
jgi:hypothetical protein